MKTETINPMKHHASTIVFVLFLALITLIGIMTSCKSKSGHRQPARQEKIVIIDSSPVRRNMHNVLKITYKVRRIEYGVVTYIEVTSDIIYEKGDTIFWTFNTIQP